MKMRPTIAPRAAALIWCTYALKWSDEDPRQEAFQDGRKRDMLATVQAFAGWCPASAGAHPRPSSRRQGRRVETMAASAVLLGGPKVRLIFRDLMGSIGRGPEKGRRQ